MDIDAVWIPTRLGANGDAGGSVELGSAEARAHPNATRHRSG